VAFPDSRPSDGVLSVVRLAPGGETARIVNYMEEGKATSHLVKYSHHPSGRVQFSQDGKVLTKIRRDAEFPLGEPGSAGDGHRLHRLPAPAGPWSGGLGRQTLLQEATDVSWRVNRPASRADAILRTLVRNPVSSVTDAQT
jgi:hypothetical protein